MKIRTLKAIACATMMALTLSVTACGGSKDAADTSAPASEAETEEAAPETESDDTAPEADAEDSVAEEAEQDVAEVEEDVAEEAEAAAESSGEYETLEDYYNDPSVKAIMDSMFASIAEEGMSAAVDVKGNEFIVIIKIEDSSMMIDGLGDALDAALEAQTDTFKEQVKQFDEAIGEEGACTVTMRYTDPDDNVLAEKSFTAN